MGMSLLWLATASAALLGFGPLSPLLINGSPGEIAQASIRRDRAAAEQASAEKPPDPQEDAVTLTGSDLRVGRDCRATFSMGVYRAQWRIDLPFDCKISRRKTGEPQIVKTRMGAALLVISSSGRIGERFCDSRVRAIVVSSEGRVYVSRHQQRFRLCSAGPFDEKMFQALAADVEPVRAR